MARDAKNLNFLPALDRVCLRSYGRTNDYRAPCQDRFRSIKQNTIQTGFLFVALLAIFNAGGRLIAGAVSDYLGRMKTILLVCISQAIIMFLFPNFSTIAAFIVGSAIVGISYGACLSLFPATAADHWGTKNLGLNYGILFTAWGLGGVLGPILAGNVADATGSYGMAYTISAALMILAAILTLFTKAPEKELVIEPLQVRALEAEAD